MLLVFLTLVHATFSFTYLSTAPQWLMNSYFRTNNEDVISSLMGSDKTPTYTFTFSSPLPGVPNLAYGIKNYMGNDYMGQ